MQIIITDLRKWNGPNEGFGGRLIIEGKSSGYFCVGESPKKCFDECLKEWHKLGLDEAVRLNQEMGLYE